MNTESKIMVVDDEPLNTVIMQEYLSDLYQHIEYAADGLECLDKLSSYTPDLILLDVSMPKMDGYEVCRRIRANPDLNDVVIIFVSAKGSVEERMQGFEAGGEDYIVKPFREEELLRKMDRILKFKSSMARLEVNLSSANSAAFEAMIGSSEMGVVVQYLDGLFKLDAKEDILQATIAFLESLELKCCVRVCDGDGEMFGSEAQLAKPLEIDVIGLLSDKGRIYSFENRVQFNFNNINVLIKNMPIDNDNKCGRLRDLLPIAFGGAESCLSSLGLKRSVEQKALVEEKISNIEILSSDIRSTVGSVTETCDVTLNRLYETLERSLPFMGLDEDQERLISGSTDEVIISVKEALASLQHIDNCLNKIIDLSR